jgi:hypothetical protein
MLEAAPLNAGAELVCLPPLFSDKPDYFTEVLMRYNGNNEQECYAHARKMGFFHSPIPDPQNFVLGILSVAEKNLISEVLLPVEQKIHKSHLLSVQDDPEDSQMAVLKLRRYTDVVFKCLPVLKLLKCLFEYKVTCVSQKIIRGTPHA